MERDNKVVEVCKEELEKQATQECQHRFVFLRREKTWEQYGPIISTDVFFCECCLAYRRVTTS